MKNIQFRENYHTHTYYCRHAERPIRAFLDSAIARGIRTLGFSDHAPYRFPCGKISNYRMQPDEVGSYVRELEALRDEYRGRLEIKIGYEAEYFPALFDDFIERITAYTCDYMILGQHFTNNLFDGIYAGDENTEEDVSLYVRQVCDGMRTGLYSFVAHPDLILLGSGDTERYLELTSEICRVSLETDTPLEINLSGIRNRCKYPKEVFWEMVGSYGCKVVMGLDAHEVEVFEGKDDLEAGVALIEKYGLNYIETPALRAPSDVLRGRA